MATITSTRKITPTKRLTTLSTTTNADTTAKVAVQLLGGKTVLPTTMTKTTTKTTTISDNLAIAKMDNNIGGKNLVTEAITAVKEEEKKAATAASLKTTKVLTDSVITGNADDVNTIVSISKQKEELAEDNEEEKTAKVAVKAAVKQQEKKSSETNAVSKGEVEEAHEVADESQDTTDSEIDSTELSTKDKVVNWLKDNAIIIAVIANAIAMIIIKR